MQKKLQYTENNQVLQQRVRDFMKSVSPKGYRELYIKSSIILILTVFVYTTPFLFSLPAWLLSCMAILMGILMSAIGMAIMHDANHGSFSKKQWVNSLFGFSIHLVGGYVPNWKMQHNQDHHSFTNSVDYDSDLETHGLFRFSKLQSWRKIHQFQAFYAPFLYGIMTLHWCTSKDFLQAYRYYKEGREKFKNISFHLVMIICSKIAYFTLWIVLPVIFWKVSWYEVLLFFFVMHFTAGLFLSLVFQPAHVSSLTEFPKPIHFKDRTEHQILTTCNFGTGNKFLTWITGGLNYQIEHHIFPYISHVHYPKIARLVEVYCFEKKLPYNKMSSFGKAIVEHFKYLHVLGKKPAEIS